MRNLCRQLVLPIFTPLVLFSPFALAQPLQSPTELNSRLFSALADHSQASENGATSDIRMRAILAERRRTLETLISSDPAAVIAAALPDDVIEAFPQDVRGLIERRVRVRGQMEISVEDGHDYSATRFALVSDGVRLGLHFADKPPVTLATGDGVEVQGVQLGNDLALMSDQTSRLAFSSNALSSNATTGSTSTASASTPLPNTFGAQKVLVILVNFQDLTTQPITPADAGSMTFTTVSNYFLNNSGQQTWLTGDVAGWYTIPVSSTVCDLTSIQTDAQQAAQNAGFILSNYNRFVYAFPQISACPWWGLSNVGGNPSNSWINGHYQLQNVGHELGHSFGLYHSHSLSCGTSIYLTSGCTVNEYGDTFDIMANVSAADITASQKELLGWLNYSTESPIQTVSTSGTYSIAPYEPIDGAVKALKIAGPNGTNYYVESRQAIGDDAFLSGFSNVTGGVLLHNYTPGSPNTSYLLNATPGGSWYSPALVVGQTFADSASGVSITPLSVSSTGASVQVSFGSIPCTRSNPSISITGLSGSVAPGATASFPVTVTNNDNSGCGTSVFGLGSTVPSGWTALYSASSLSLAPGTSGSATLQVTAPAGTANGTYPVSANTSNSAATSYSAVASTSETIYAAPAACTHANPSLSIAGPSGSVAPGVAASFTVSVTNNDSSGCSSSVFGLGDVVPSGWTAVYSASSVSLAPAGSASVTLQVTAPSSTANGTYTVGASAVNAGYTTYTASVSGSETIYAASTAAVTVTTSQPSYTRGQKVSVSVTVKNGSTAVAGATVNVKITKSNGSAVTVSGTTGSNGVAVLAYQSKKSDPTGTWQAMGSSGSSSSSTSFLMQ